MKVKISSLKKKLNESILLWPGPGSFGSSKSKKSIPLSLSSVSLAGSVFRDELLESSQSSQNNFRSDKQSNEAVDKKQMIETNSQSFSNSMASVRSSSSKSSSYSSSSYSSSSSSSGCSSAASSCLSSASTSTSSSSSTEMIEMLMISDENKQRQRNETSFRSSSLSSPPQLEATLSAASSGYSCNFFGKLSAATTKLRYVDDDDEPNSCGSETDDNDRDHQNENEEDEELDDENERTLFISKSKCTQMLRRTTIISTRN